jgi:S-disulfanyl-L-cysteine oxidoreductase SoxD
MTFRTAVLGAGMIWLAAVVAQPRVDAQQKTVWDGVYSEEQATRGQAAYEAECSSCHQADFAGDGFAPSLAGPEFASAWNDLSVGDLYDRIRQSMPPTDPGAVQAATKVDIVAYLLKGNKMPAGSTELPKEVDGLKQIKYLANKP